MRSSLKTLLSVFFSLCVGNGQSHAVDIINLGVTSGWINSTAIDVSDDGSVVVGNDDGTGNINTSMPFIWNSNTNSRMQLSGPINSGFSGISADGTKAVGYFASGGLNSAPGGGPFIHNVSTGQTSLISATSPPGFGGFMEVRPTGISGDGSTITAMGYTNSGNHLAVSGPYGGPLTSLPASDEATAYASSYNGTHIVGSMLVRSLGTGHAFLYSGGNYTDLGTINANSTATSVSADGSIVVGFSISHDQNYSASFIWTAANGMVNMNVPSGKSSALDISSDGYMIVGKMFNVDDGNHAYIYDRATGQTYDLQNVLASNGVTGASNWSRLYSANAISGNSTTGYNIVGQGLIGGETRAFLIKGLTTLTPVPEPSTYALATIASVLMAFSIRRRNRSKVCLIDL
jgi:uncharacterized membrane protein